MKQANQFTKQDQIKLFLRLVRYITPFWDKYLLIIILMIIQGTIHTLPVLLLSKLSYFIGAGQTVDYLRFSALMLFPALIFRWVIFDSLLYTLVWYLGLKLAFRIRVDLYRKLQLLPLSFYQSRPIGEHIYRANADIDALLPLLNSTMSGIPAFISSIYQTVLMAYLVSIAGADILLYLTLLLIPIYFSVHILYGTVQRLDYLKRARAQELTAVLRENIAGIRIIKAFDRVKYAIRQYYRAMVKFYKTSQAAYFMQIFADQIRVSPVHILWPLSLPFFAYLGLQGKIPIITWGSIVYFSRAMLYFLDGTYSFIQKIRLYLIPAQRLFETLDLTPQMIEPLSAKKIPHFTGQLEFEHVHFSYEQGHPVLNDISFKLPAGKKLAIIGHSGAGKSTIAMLALRLYPQNTGAIRIDSIDIRTLKIAPVLQQIGVILQDTFLFGGTIRDNICYGKPNATDEEIIQAAMAAGIHNDITNMPGAYAMDVAEGASLSGGQKQRIAIARALLKKPKLLILDEVTSSLDIGTEKEILDNLRTNFPDISTIIISHRLRAVADADEILVIDKGQIIERGTHGQLLQHKKMYYQLYQHQSDLELTKQLNNENRSSD